MSLSKIDMPKIILDPETFMLYREIVIRFSSEEFEEEKARKGVDGAITILVSEYEKFLRDLRAQQTQQAQKES